MQLEHRGRLQAVFPIDHEHPRYLFRMNQTGLVEWEQDTDLDVVTTRENFEPVFGAGPIFGHFDPPIPGPRFPLIIRPWQARELHTTNDLAILDALQDHKYEADIVRAPE